MDASLRTLSPLLAMELQAEEKPSTLRPCIGPTRRPPASHVTLGSGLTLVPHSRWDKMRSTFVVVLLFASSAQYSHVTQHFVDGFFFQHILVKRTERSFSFGTLPDEENKVQNYVFNVFQYINFKNAAKRAF